MREFLVLPLLVAALASSAGAAATLQKVQGGVRITETGAVVRGLDIEAGGSDGLVIEASGVTIENVRIRGARHGIVVRGGRDLRLARADIAGATGDAILVEDRQGAIEISDSTLNGNGGAGMRLLRVGEVANRNVIAQGNGACVTVSGAASYSANNLLCQENLDGGVLVDDISGSVTLTDVAMIDNDNDDDGIGDGFRALDGPDVGNTLSIGGSLNVYGSRFWDTMQAGKHQTRGIYVLGVGGGVLLTHTEGDPKYTEAAGNESDGIRIAGAGGLVLVTAGGRYGLNGGSGLVLHSVSAASLSGVEADQNGAHGVELSDVDTVTVSGGEYHDNGLAGLRAQLVHTGVVISGGASFTGHPGATDEDAGVLLVNVGTVSLLSLAASGNRTGVRVDGAVSVSDTDGNYSDNFRAGLSVDTVTGGVTLIRTVLDDNVSYGFQAEGLPAIGGNLLCSGVRARETTGVQNYGITVSRVTGSATFQNDGAQPMELTGNSLYGLQISDGGTSATLINGDYSSNGQKPFELTSFSGAVTINNLTMTGGPLLGGVTTAGSLLYTTSAGSAAETVTLDTISLQLTGQTKIEISAVPSWTISTGDGDDHVIVRSSSGSVSATLNGGNGDDAFSLGSAANSLGPLDGALIINGNGHGAFTYSQSCATTNLTMANGDTIVFSDQGDADANTYVLSTTQVTRSGSGTVTYAGIEEMVLLGGTGADTFTLDIPSGLDFRVTPGTASANIIRVNSVAAGAVADIAAGNHPAVVFARQLSAGGVLKFTGGDPGNNLSLGSTANSLDQIGAAVCFTSGGGTDTVFLNDHGDLDSNTYAVGENWAYRNGLQILSYNAEALVLNAGTGAAGDAITVTPAAATAFTIDGNFPDAAPPPVGDQLKLMLHGVAAAQLTPSAADAGQYTFGNRQPIAFDDIETFQPPGVFRTLAPCRLVDTRTAFAPLNNGVVRTVSLAANPCGVPVTATSVAVNLTAIPSASSGTLSLYPGDLGSAPVAGTVPFASQNRGNNAVIAVGASGFSLRVHAALTAGAAVHFVLDVVGYFE